MYPKAKKSLCKNTGIFCASLWLLSFAPVGVPANRNHPTNRKKPRHVSA